MKNFSLFIVAAIIIGLYLLSFSILIYILSFLPYIDVKIYSFKSVLIFVFYIFIWLIPYGILSYLYDIRILSHRLKLAFKYFVQLVSVSLFVVYVIWLENKIEGIYFSNLSLIICISLLLILYLLIVIKGEQLKEGDKHKR